MWGLPPLLPNSDGRFLAIISIWKTTIFKSCPYIKLKKHENNNVPFGALGDGKTVDEAIADFNNSVDEMRAFYAEEGKEFPQIEFEFKYLH